MRDNEQPLLPWDFLEEKPSPPDLSELPRFADPKDDNERLLNFQWAARNGDGTAYGGMYELGRKVALKYINKAAKGNGHVAALGEAEKAEKAHNAITYIVERFLKESRFRIRKSFTAYLYLRVQHELFYRRKVDAIVRFVDMERFATATDQREQNFTGAEL